MGVISTTVRIVPQSINATSGSISNSQNALTDTDSNTYATLTPSQSASDAYYTFDLSDIPTGANVTAFEFKLKVTPPTQTTLMQSYYEFEGNSGSEGRSQIHRYTSSEAGVITLTTFVNYTSSSTTITWSDIVSGHEYSSSYPRIYVSSNNKRDNTWLIYGAELDVTYQTWEPDTHGIFNLILPRG